jgi:Zn-dependent protease with chaperone function
MDARPTLAAAATISAMRQESLFRTGLLILILCIIPSLIASAFPGELSDLILPLGPPLTHVINAVVLFAAVFGVMLAAKIELDRRSLWPRGGGPNIGPTVPGMVEQLAQKLGMDVEVEPFGGPTDGEIESVMVGRRKVIRIATTQLREAKRNPDGFRYILAHELTHLAAGDPRTDQRITCAYSIGALFMLAAFAGVMWNVGGVIVTSIAFGVKALIVGIRTVWLPIFANVASMATLAILLLLETRSAVRLREFHADAVAAALVGPNPHVLNRPDQVKGGRLKRFLGSLLSDHPNWNLRRLALTERSAAFRADQILFVLQGFFAATITELLLQMLLVNASPGVSTLVERQQYFRESLSQFPWTVPGVIVAAALIVAVSQSLVFSRLRVTVLEMGGARKISSNILRMPVLVGVGACLALLSSQTFLWEFSQRSWQFGAWVATDPDRNSVYAASLLGTILSLMLILADDGRWSLTRPGTIILSFIPIACSLAAGLWFYG